MIYNLQQFIESLNVRSLDYENYFKEYLIEREEVILTDRLIITNWDDDLESNIKFIKGNITIECAYIPSFLNNIEIDGILKFTKLKEIGTVYNLPKKVKTLSIPNAGITSFNEFPEHITNLEVYGNKIESLHGIPQMLKSLSISKNPLKSLKHCPPKLKSLNIILTYVESLEYISPVLTKLTTRKSKLKSYEHLPTTLSNFSIPNNSQTPIYEYVEKYCKINRHYTYLNIVKLFSTLGINTDIYSFEETFDIIKGLE